MNPLPTRNAADRTPRFNVSGPTGRSKHARRCPAGCRFIQTSHTKADPWAKRAANRAANRRARASRKANR